MEAMKWQDNPILHTWRVSWYRTLWVGLVIITSLNMGCFHENSSQRQSNELVGRVDLPEPPVRGGLAYRIVWQDEHLDVHIRLAKPPNRARFFLPQSWRGGEDYSKAISIAGARDSEGPLFLTIDRVEGHVEILSEDSDWIELHYVVRPSLTRELFAPAYYDNLLVLFAPTFLVLPAQQVLERVVDVPIEVLVPRDWKIVATWKEVTRRPSEQLKDYTVAGFIAADGLSARDAFLVAGNLDVRESGPNAVVFDPNFLGDRDAFVHVVQRTLSYYQSVLGDLGSVRVLVQPSHSPEYEWDGLGRKGGFVLRLPVMQQIDPETHLLILHEALHLWNGHHVVARDQKTGATSWFTEGVTHFIALQSGCRMGVFGMKFALAEIARSAQAYMANPVSRGESGASIDQQRFPYDHGFLISLFLEGMATDGASALNWLIELERAVPPPRRYSREDLLRALGNVSEESRRRLSPHIHGTPLSVDQILRDLGLHLIPGSSDTRPRVIPLSDVPARYLQALSHCQDDR